MSGGRTGSDSRSGASRLLDVLAVFENGPGALAVKEIAEAARLPVSTTYRIVKDLVEWDGLERLEDGRYRPGRRLRQFGARWSWEQELRSVCGPLVQHVALEWGHAIALSAWDGSRLVCIETIGGRHPTIELASSGDELPVLATSAGKLILATTLRGADPFTGQLPARTNARTIIEQMAAARRHGFCTAYGEAAAGQASLSVPVGGVAHGHMALTVLTPVGDRGLTRLVDPLRRAATTLRETLDFHSARSALATGSRPASG